ncbi:MAG TPA: von Willebrand factor type A domain-containing protein [Planctomycetota bacterium]|nr:von Willebrand factor type A domain-containing protein [Planctomycetota bacterium]
MNSTNPHGSFGCDSFAEELSLFVFGELPELQGERRDALERHLVDCAACCGERDALVRSLEILKQEGAGGARETAPQLSAARQANLLAQAQATAPKRGQVIAWRRAAVAAMVVAVAGAAWYATQATDAGSDRRFALTSEATSVARGEPDASRFGQSPAAGKAADAAAAKPATAAAAPAGSARSLTNLHIDLDRIEQLKREESKSGEMLVASGEGAARGESKSRSRAGDGGTERGPTSTNPSAPSGDHRKRLSGAPAGPQTGGPTTPPPGDRSSLDTSTAGQRGLDSQPKPQPDPLPTAQAGAPADSAKGDGHHGLGLSRLPMPSEKAPGSKDEFVANPTIGYLHEDEASSEGIDAGVEEMLSGFESPPGPLDSDDESRSALARIGYINEGGDDATGGKHDSLDGFEMAGFGYSTNARTLTPAQLGRLLAASLSPAQLLRVQALIVAKLGTAPGQPPRPGLEADRDVVVREFLDRLSRRQSEPPRDMFFRYFGDHPFIPTRIDAKSTFGMDVDTASSALARAYLSRGTLPPTAAVRTEEFVNAFRHDLAPPDADGLANAGRVRDDDRPAAGFAAPAARDVFAIHTEIAPSPFGEEGHYLLQIGLKAREIPKSQRKPIALTFVIDVSGSMEQDGRLELVKKGLHLLLDQLTERDTVGIVSFESTGHRVLDPIDATQRGRIFAALDALRPEGSTNVDQGLRLGYEMALSQLRPNAENRVVLCSDGVANTGVTDANWLSARIAECKSKYVYLNCIGVGMGNHNDALMEQLADQGDGFCAYIDRIEEAKKLFVDRLTGTLLTVARNAKIQVEFDPAGVRRFRQLGYENRALAHRDFRNDKVDAGEVGAGQEVVALYEVELARDALARDAGARDTNVPLAAVRVRYEDPDAGAVREQERRVAVSDLRPTLQQATPRFRLSACVAEFAEILRQSVHARDGSLGAVERLAEPLVDELPGDPDVPEFVALVKQAARLPDLIPVRSGLARACDEVKRFHCWREELHDGATDEQLHLLEEQNRRLEQALRDALDRALRGS